MPYRQTFTSLAIAWLTLASLAACGKKDKEEGTPGYAKLSLANSTTSYLTSAVCQNMPGGTTIPEKCWTPSMYAIKMLAVYISADAEGSQNSPAGLIWANPACPGRTSDFEMGSGEDQKTIKYDVLDACDDQTVTSYFDFARPSSAVNAELNSQDKSIPPGTYNYVQMNFCIGGAKTKNLRFKTEGMETQHEISTNSCGVHSAPMSTPIVIGEGEAVTVSVEYDLTDIIYQNGSYKDPNYCYASSDGTTVRCVSSFRKLAPSFTKR